MTTSGEVCSASSRAASIAPGSSGLGNETVGNIGSGSACEDTGMGAGYPAATNARRTVSVPTPCSAVCTTVTSRGLSAATTVRTSARYASSTESSSVSQPSSAIGTDATEVTFAISAAMSPSTGDTICEPSPT